MTESKNAAHWQGVQRMPSGREDKQCPMTESIDTAHSQGMQTLSSGREHKHYPMTRNTNTAQWQRVQTQHIGRECKNWPVTGNTNTTQWLGTQTLPSGREYKHSLLAGNTNNIHWQEYKHCPVAGSTHMHYTSSTQTTDWYPIRTNNVTTILEKGILTLNSKKLRPDKDIDGNASKWMLVLTFECTLCCFNHAVYIPDNLWSLR